MSTSKICTWNVNGIRSRKNLPQVFRDVGADIFCIQETKISKDQIDENLAIINNVYYSCFAIPKQVGFKGRSGCATYYKDSARPYHAEYGLFDEQTCSDSWKELINTDNKLDDIKNLDSEGRVLVTCHDIHIHSGDQLVASKLYILNVYFPRLDPEKEERVEFKDRFNKMIQKKVKHLLGDTNAHVIIGCDLNIIHKQIDSCEKEEHFDDCIYRRWLSELLEPKEDPNSEPYLIDSFRKFYPDKKYAYTCWPTLIIGARENNLGSRIDYILIDSKLAPYVSDVQHLTNIPGSDHCPVMIELNNVSFVASKSQPYGCTRTWHEFCKRQTSLRDYFITKQRSPQSNNESNNNILSYEMKTKIEKKSQSQIQFPVLSQAQSDSQRIKNKKTSEIKSPSNKPLSGYQMIMQKKTAKSKPKPKPQHCPSHGLICEPRQNQKKNTSNYLKYFFRCPNPECKFFRWESKTF